MSANYTYFVEISSPSCNPIILGDESNAQNKDVIGIEIFFDTIDNDVRQKAGGMLAKIKIIGEIKESTQKSLVELFNWSKELGGDKWYRKVEIKILSGGELKRNYSFENMFVVDYKEIYKVSGTQDREQFELYLTQQENNFKDIETYAI